jgi:hypothetical protein
MNTVYACTHSYTCMHTALRYYFIRVPWDLNCIFVSPRGYVEKCSVENPLKPGETSMLGPAWITSLYFFTSQEILNSCSSWLLLVVASTALGFGARRNPSSYFYSFKTFACYVEIGPPLRREVGSNYCWSVLLYWRLAMLALTHFHSVLVSYCLSLRNAKICI